MTTYACGVPPDTIHAAIREEMPNIPLPDYMEVGKQVQECIEKYGALRAMTIGRIIAKLVGADL